MAKSSYSKVDEYGFERPDHFNYEMYDEFMSRYMRVLIRRAQRWDSLKSAADKYAKSNTLKRFVRKGIPLNHRVAAWMSISGAEKVRNSSRRTYTEMKQNITNPALIDIIRIDLPRTFPDNIFFSTNAHLPQQLFNVLGAFAHQNTDVGYCQGLNYIAGLLLLATKNEEASFWLLKTLVEHILPRYYVSSMCGLLTDLDVLDELVLKSEPVVHRHVKDIGMPWAMGTTKWFICLYSEVLPTETVFRIWDCLFYEGSKILFRVGLTLIKMHKEEILQTTDLSELCNCFKKMRDHQNVIDCHKFMTDIFRVPGRFPNRNLDKLRKKHEQK